MNVADFDFQLPEELIALYPPENRTDSRLLQLNGSTSQITHGAFSDILSYLQPQDLLVMNNTKVMPARFFGTKASGGKLEFLVERVLDEHEVLLHIKSSRSPKPGSDVLVESRFMAQVLGRQDSLFHLRFEDSIWDVMDAVGHMPLPPYIERSDEQGDRQRYQTVYAEKLGAVAAPTAGLHFDLPLLEKIKNKGVEIAYVTLHVGAGTFQPVKVESVEEHKMHSEYFEISNSVAEKMNACRARGGRIVAVGTTSVRSLESLAAAQWPKSANSKDERTPSKTGVSLSAYSGETDIFIYPGYSFQLVDAMITNFHLPKSTLLMLVSAFAGKDAVMNAYQQAIEQRYRFFSYGDAMLIYRD